MIKYLDRSPLIFYPDFILPTTTACFCSVRHALKDLEDLEDAICMNVTTIERQVLDRLFLSVSKPCKTSRNWFQMGNLTVGLLGRSGKLFLHFALKFQAAIRLTGEGAGGFLCTEGEEEAKYATALFPRTEHRLYWIQEM